MRTLFDKVWDSHVVADLGAGWSLLHIDRHLLHDLSGGRALTDVLARGLPVRNPALAAATPDHAVSSAPGRAGDTASTGGKLRISLRDQAAAMGVRFFDVGQDGQGIVHVMAPELGLVLPGTTVICGDSHTCTNGGLGALAFGVGSSELTHALATQTLRQRRPRTMRIRIDGRTGPGVTAKDLALHLIRRLGASAGTGYAVEYAGAMVRAMSIEERMTLCNLSIEMGAKIGMVAPDDATYAYVAGRRFAPSGAMLDQAICTWRTLPTDDDASFDREEALDAAAIAPTVTWGTSPEHAIGVDEAVPDPAGNPAWGAAIDYMGLAPGQPIAGTAIDWVFIGSCANSRLPDLRAAAAIARDRHVAPASRPGSSQDRSG